LYVREQAIAAKQQCDDARNGSEQKSILSVEQSPKPKSSQRCRIASVHSKSHSKICVFRISTLTNFSDRKTAAKSCRPTSACGGRGPLRCHVPSALPFRVAGHAAEARVRWATAVCVEPWRQVASPDAVSPTIFREGPYRFYFFSREERRIHVHVASGDGEAKFWLSPEIELAEVHGLPEREITKLVTIIRNHEQQIRAAWVTHFGT